MNIYFANSTNLYLSISQNMLMVPISCAVCGLLTFIFLKHTVDVQKFYIYTIMSRMQSTGKRIRQIQNISTVLLLIWLSVDFYVLMSQRVFWNDIVFRKNFVYFTSGCILYFFNILHKHVLFPSTMNDDNSLSYSKTLTLDHIMTSWYRHTSQITSRLNEESIG